MAFPNLKPENYKGVLIKFGQKNTNGKKFVVGKWILKRNPFELAGHTKLDAYTKIKHKIDRSK